MTSPLAMQARKRNLRRQLASAEIERRWKVWIEGPAQCLVKAGLPSDILIDDQHWMDFVMHGTAHFYHSKRSYTAYNIPEEKIEEVLEFLENNLDVDVKSESVLIQVLRERSRAKE